MNKMFWVIVRGRKPIKRGTLKNLAQSESASGPSFSVVGTNVGVEWATKVAGSKVVVE